MNDRFTRIKWLVSEGNFDKISQTKVLVADLVEWVEFALMRFIVVVFKILL